ncbi:MAG: DUF1257 domain-containing protein [Nitrospira sp. CR1.3]|nr:DUF1257 domain-containing protein [Nitrospira sp. CR1.3]
MVFNRKGIPMSHIAEVNLLVQDLNALQRACRRLGLELVRGQQTYRWYGRSVGDHPLPVGFAKDELGTCEHAIQIPGNDHAYEIGIVTRRDGKPGYVLLWDFYQGGYGLVDRVGENAERLQQLYALEVTLGTIEEMNHCVVEQNQLADGSIELVLAQQGV